MSKKWIEIVKLDSRGLTNGINADEKKSVEVEYRELVQLGALLDDFKSIPHERFTCCANISLSVTKNIGPTGTSYSYGLKYESRNFSTVFPDSALHPCVNEHASLSNAECLNKICSGECKCSVLGKLVGHTLFNSKYKKQLSAGR